MSVDKNIVYNYLHNEITTQLENRNYKAAISFLGGFVVLLRTMGKWNHCIKFENEIQKLAIEYGFSDFEAESYKNIGEFYRRTNKYELSLENLDKAEFNYLFLSDVKNIIECQIQRAITYIKMGLLDKSFSILDKSQQKLFEITNTNKKNLDNESFEKNNLSILEKLSKIKYYQSQIFKIRESFNNFKENIDESIKIAQDMHFDDILFLCYDSYVDYFFREKDYFSAEKYLLKLNGLNLKNGICKNLDEYVNSYLNKINYYKKIPDYSETINGLFIPIIQDFYEQGADNQFEKTKEIAISNFEDCVNLGRELEIYHVNTIDGYTKLAMNQEIIGRYIEAIRVQQEHLQYIYHNNKTPSLWYIYSSIASNYKKIGNNELSHLYLIESLKYVENFNKLNDKIGCYFKLAEFYSELNFPNISKYYVGLATKHYNLMKNSKNIREYEQKSYQNNYNKFSHIIIDNKISFMMEKEEFTKHWYKVNSKLEFEWRKKLLLSKNINDMVEFCYFYSVRKIEEKQEDVAMDILTSILEMEITVDSELLSKIYLLITKILYDNNRYEEATSYFLTIINNFIENIPIKIQIYFYNNYAILNHYKGNRDESIKHFDKALNLAQNYYDNSIIEELKTNYEINSE